MRQMTESSVGEIVRVSGLQQREANRVGKGVSDDHSK